MANKKGAHMNREQLKKMGDIEDNAGSVSVGGLAADTGMIGECPHMHFVADVAVGRLEPSKAGEKMRFCADVKIQCSDCGLPFRFIGLPAGLDLNGAATSIDATEARLAIAPKGEVVSVLEGGVSGFSIRNTK